MKKISLVILFITLALISGLKKTKKQDGTITPPVQSDSTQQQTIPVKLNAAQIQIQSDNKQQTVPVQLTNLPAPQQSAPQQNSIPIQLAAAPVQLQSVPIQQQTVPVQLTTAPVQLQSAPIQQQTVPVQLTNIPVQSAPIQQQATIPSYTAAWITTSFSASDIGVGAEGDVYVVGLDTKLYSYNFLKNCYEFVEGDYELTQITRVDVDDDGTPYVIANSGQLYYLNCHNHWVQLPGCGTDIGVGRGNEVWKIGCDARAGGFGIWKLFCKAKSNCGSERNCNRWRNNKYTAKLGEGEKSRCYWYRVEGGAIKIDVHPDGNPWVATDAGYVYGYDSINWHHIQGVLARDISVSNEGMVFAAGVDFTMWALENVDTMTWAGLSGTGMEVSAGPYSQPWSIGSDKNIWSTSKMGFN